MSDSGEGIIQAGRRWLQFPARSLRDWRERHPLLTWFIWSIAVLAVIVATVVAIRSLPRESDIEIAYLGALFLVLVPATWILNAARFHYLVRAMHIDPVGWTKALKLAGLSTLANNLPLPGGLLVRVAALKKTETSYRDIAWLSASSMLLWVTAVLLLVSLAMAVLGAKLAGVVALVGGILFLVGSVRCFPAGTPRHAMLGLGAVEFSMVMVELARLWLSFEAISVHVDPARLAILVAASITGSAAGFLPAGIGVREGMTVGLGLLVGVAPAAAMVAAIINRVAGLVFLTIISPWLIRK